MYFIELLYTGLQKTKLCTFDKSVLVGSGWIKWAGQDECCWEGARRHFCSFGHSFMQPPLLLWFCHLHQKVLYQLVWNPASFSVPALLPKSFVASAPLPQTFGTRPPCRQEAWFFVGMRISTIGRENCSLPVEGVHSVGASEHGEPWGNKELEVGWPGDSRRHPLAIDSSLVWCEWQSFATIDGAPPSSSVPACQALASSCTQSKSLSHPPSQDLKLYFVPPIFILPSNWSWKIQVQLQERRRTAETWNSNTILNTKTSFWIHGFKSSASHNLNAGTCTVQRSSCQEQLQLLDGPVAGEPISS